MASRFARLSKILHSKLRLLVLFLVAIPAVSWASNNCPWMTDATAGGLLGGEAVGAFTRASTSQPAVCSFAVEVDGVRRTLRITVAVAADPHKQVAMEALVCGHDVDPLKAIGNEALACTVDDHGAGPGERAVGRVRDQVFTITLASSQEGGTIFTRDELKSKIYTAAEQVSGNLF